MKRGALWCVALLGLPHGAWAQEPMLPEAAQLQGAASLDALYGCFRAGTHEATGGGRTVDFGPGTEAFFLEQLGAAMQAHGNTLQLGWCEPWFVYPYVRAHVALHGDAQSDALGATVAAPAHGPHMPLSTGVHQGKEDRLIHLASRMGGVSHVSAHADMVRHAMAAPAVAKELRRLSLGTCPRGLLMQGAQVPDLYLFGHPLWHAQTEQAASRASSRDRFVALVVLTVQQAREAALREDVERAMVLLGAAAHAVQDLVYHRGMTQQEKAGLTYRAHSNPDLPPEPQDQRLRMQATRNTSALLAAALAPLQAPIGGARDSVVQDHELPLGLITSLWPEARALDYVALKNYFELGASAQSPAALGQANLGHWATEATLWAILGAL